MEYIKENSVARTSRLLQYYNAYKDSTFLLVGKTNQWVAEPNPDVLLDRDVTFEDLGITGLTLGDFKALKLTLLPVYQDSGGDIWYGGLRYTSVSTSADILNTRCHNLLMRVSIDATTVTATTYRQLAIVTSDIEPAITTITAANILNTNLELVINSSTINHAGSETFNLMIDF